MPIYDLKDMKTSFTRSMSRMRGCQISSDSLMQYLSCIFLSSKRLVFSVIGCLHVYCTLEFHLSSSFTTSMQALPKIRKQRRHVFRNTWLWYYVKITARKDIDRLVHAKLEISFRQTRENIYGCHLSGQYNKWNGQ